MKNQKLRVFVTGATGLLGSNIVSALLKGQHQVTALVRSVEKSKSAFSAEVERVEGDLRDTDRFEAALAGHDVLIHSAAYFSEYQKDGSEGPLYETNVKGTAALLEAAHRRGVRNCVYVSSAGVLDPREGQATDESCAYPACADNRYFESKINAEQEVFRFLESHPTMRVVTILPTVMLGPGDRAPTPIGSLVLKLLSGEMKIVLPGAVQLVDARDVADAVVAGIHRGDSGNRYIVGGQRITQRAFYEALGAVAGKPMPTKQPPYRALLTLAWIMKQLGRVTGRRPKVDPTHIKRMNQDFWFTSVKAERELGVVFRPLSKTLADTVEWFQAEPLA